MAREGRVAAGGEAGGAAEDLVTRPLSPLHVCPAGNSEDFKLGVRVRMDLDLGT